MSVSTSPGAILRQDRKKGIYGGYGYFVGAATPAVEAAIVIDPPTEMDSLRVVNFSPDYDLKVTVKGKDDAGAAVTLGEYLVPPAGADGGAGFSPVIRNAADQAQTIDAIEVLPVLVAQPAASGFVAAGAAAVTAATLPTGTVVKFLPLFNNE